MQYEIKVVSVNPRRSATVQLVLVKPSAHCRPVVAVVLTAHNKVLWNFKKEERLGWVSPITVRYAWIMGDLHLIIVSNNQVVDVLSLALALRGRELFPSQRTRNKLIVARDLGLRARLFRSEFRYVSLRLAA